MPRANRHFLPGPSGTSPPLPSKEVSNEVCARSAELFALGLRSEKALGLSVLDYSVSSNQVHLLIKDTGPNVIARSMQLIAIRSGQEYNQRKRRQGAFWEDRYHATAIETDEHLHRCLVYIDLNMVRAGVVDHPVKWLNSGYHEIQQPRKRYAVIDLPGLVALCGFSKLADFQQAHRQWVEATLKGKRSGSRVRWSEAVAVGSLDFVEKVKSELGIKAWHCAGRKQATFSTFQLSLSAYFRSRQISHLIG